MTVGLVVVCHSATLARGVAELGRAMSTDEIRLSVAAGIDGPENVLGTDALQVARAIEEVYSDDGVLVLMDVGSAVLAAEFALEMLPSERAARVRLTAAPLVEGLLAAAVQSAAGADLDAVEQAALDGLSSKRAHLGDEVITPHRRSAVEPNEHTDELRIHVDLPHGFHARPAARIVATVSAFDATVTVANCTNDRGPVTAASLNAVMALGVGPAHDVLFRASGRQASEALAALEELARTGFGDSHQPAKGATRGVSPESPGGSDRELTGLAGSPGLGFGVVHWMGGNQSVPAPEPGGDSADVAIYRLRAALVAVDDTLRVTVQGAANRDVAEIIETQRVLLSDPTLMTAAEERVVSLGHDAGSAWLGAISQASDSLRDAGDEYLMARIEDLEAIGRAVVGELNGTARTDDNLSGVIASSEMSPAQAARLDPTRVCGVVTRQGSPSSHSTIVLRSLGIPAVVGVGSRLADVETGTYVIVDGNAGRVIVAPADSLVRSAIAEREHQGRSRADQLTRAGLPATTLDGEVIDVRANVGSIEDAESAHANGADGAGLVRTEFLFLDRTSPPTEDEQAEHYSRICAAMPNSSVVLRTLDVGGDKHVPYLRTAGEANPYLGNRGIRLALSHPELLAGQLRAMLRAAASHSVRIMLPMVTLLDEIATVRRMLDAEREALVANGVPVPAHVPLGVMVETPALALRIASVLPSVDFVSIGTNDLVQYTTAAERGNLTVDHLYDALDPSVLRLVSEVAQQAATAQVPVSLCGVVAEDPLGLTVLVGLGIRDFSVPPSLVPELKERVRQIDTTHARRIAEWALTAPSATVVREMLADNGRSGPRTG